MTYHSGCDTIFNEKVCILYTYLVEKSYGKCKDGESRLSEILQRIPGRSEKGSDAERDERKMIEHGSRAAQQHDVNCDGSPLQRESVFGSTHRGFSREAEINQKW